MTSSAPRLSSSLGRLNFGPPRLERGDQAWPIRTDVSCATSWGGRTWRPQPGVVGWGTQAAELFPWHRLRRRQHLLWQRTAVLAGMKENVRRRFDSED